MEPTPTDLSGKSNGDATRVRRSYVACIACRKRKVKCTINSEPPCAKCQREHRDCKFARTPAASKRREAPRWVQHSPSTPSDAVPPSSSLQHSIHSDTDHRADTRYRVAEPQDHARLSSANAWTDDGVVTAVVTQPRQALEVLFDTVHSGSQHVQHISEPDVGVSTQTACKFPLVGPSPLSNPQESVLDTWDKFRFVRQGWFTAQEAVTYIDLFFRDIYPLCPVMLDDFQDHAKHEKLITEEPLLCCAILTISSRFHTLEGSGGYSRGHHVHSRLWQHCERLIHRLMLGQEKTSSAKIRSIGTVEALILISEWQPRALHFPPDTDGWDSAFVPDSWTRQDRVGRGGETAFVRWREDVFEPAKRADRMSWMLLGAATSLLCELSTDSVLFSSARFLCTRRLLCIHVSQLSTRLGCASLLPSHLADELSTTLIPGLDTVVEKPAWISLVALWTELVTFEKAASAMLFQSPASFRHSLADNRYKDILQYFVPTLARWQTKCNNCQDISFTMQSVLHIQFLHLRINVRAVSLQAVVNRTQTQQLQGTYEVAGFSISVLAHDEIFIQELIQDCHALLLTAEQLAHAQVLRYAPIRTLIYVTSASVFLMKAMSVQIRNVDLKSSLSVLERGIKVLKSSPVDDMDFAARYASLIEKNVAHFMANFKASRPSRHHSPRGDVAVSHLSSSGRPDSLRGPMAGASYISSMPPMDATGLDLDGTMEEPDFFSTEWWSQPFDPAIAPFGTNEDHLSMGFDLSSLDFLWHLQP